MKINIGYSERSNTKYYSNSEIIDTKPIEGDFYNNEKIIFMDTAHLDCEQPNDDVYNYEHFIVQTENADDKTDVTIHYVAVLIEEWE